MKQPEAAPTKVGGLVAIKKRLCSPKVQPGVKIGQVYKVLDVGTTKSGSERLVCMEHEMTCVKHQPKRATINADRFVWAEVTEKDVAYARKKADEAYKQILTYRFAKAKKQDMEKKFNDDVVRTTQEMIRTMTWDEHVEITIKPLIAIELAWMMAEACCKYCAENKISEVLKVTRGIRHLKEEYYNFLGLDLDRRNVNDLREKATAFLGDQVLSLTMERMKHTLRNEYYASYGEVPFLDLRCLATIGIIFIAAYKRRVERANALISEKAKELIDKSIENTLITDRLLAQFDALLGDWVIEQSTHIRTFEGILDNHLNHLKVVKLEEENNKIA